MDRVIEGPLYTRGQELLKAVEAAKKKVNLLMKQSHSQSVAEWQDLEHKIEQAWHGLQNARLELASFYYQCNPVPMEPLPHEPGSLEAFVEKFLRSQPHK